VRLRAAVNAETARGSSSGGRSEGRLSVWRQNGADGYGGGAFGALPFCALAIGRVAAFGPIGRSSLCLRR